MSSPGRKAKLSHSYQLLESGPPRTVIANACLGDGLPSFLGGGLVGEDRHHLWHDGRVKSLEGTPVLVEVDVTMPEGIPHLLHLQLDLHDRAPIGVVHLPEHQPRCAPAGVLEDRLNDKGSTPPPCATP
jgi:hypothetical protein